MQSDKLPVINRESATASATSAAPAGNNGYWRSLNELEQTPEFTEHLHREFPQAASEFPEGVSRRRWLKLMSASLALSGVAGCRYGRNEIAPLVVRPENMIPGVPKHYATSFELAGRAVQLLVSNVDGRPIKVEGNKYHRAMKATEPNDLSDGNERFASAGTDVFSQGCILGLYDPDRVGDSDPGSCVIQGSGEESSRTSWEAFAEYARGQVEKLKENQGESLGILMSPSLSPSVNRMVGEILSALPKATIAQHSAIDASTQLEACAQAAGEPAELLLDLSKAKIICCLDSDLLGNDPNMLIYSRQFSQGRKPEPDKMNRLYAVESRFSVTGSSADSRLAIQSSQMGAFIARLENRVNQLLDGGQPSSAGEEELPYDSPEVSNEERVERFIEAMAEDLVAHRGESVVSVGSHQPFDVQMCGLRLNQRLGNVGQTAMLMPSRYGLGDAETTSISEFASNLGIDIDNVWILGDNPVYSAPSKLKLGEKLSELEHVVYFAEFVDETAEVADWNVPLAHPLETWGDVLGADGSFGLAQPQIRPLLNGKSQIEILALMLGQPAEGEGIVRESANLSNEKPLTSRQWREALHDGFVGSYETQPLEGEWNTEAPTPMGNLTPGEIENGELEVVFTPSDVLYDGRFAKNVWMQELPQAITKLTWDNAALMSPATAKELRVTQGELVKLVHETAELELPVFLVPGQAAGSISVHLGYGRVCRDEAVDSNEQVFVGVDVTPLRPEDNSHILTGVEGRPTSKEYKLATTQDHFAIDDLGLEITKERAATLVREGTLEQIEEGGEDYVEHLGTHHPALESLWEEPIAGFEEDPTVLNQWGMTIDLNKCTGCNACVVACQAENNIPVVGKEQVSRGREMHWIRVDRYFRGDVEAPQIVNQPVACVHCETAPCEQVCPVAATVHTEEGINAMAYNRCVGTRYCANNCPYKVRRFNYFNYNTEYGYFYGWQQRGKLDEASRKLQQLVLNPEVTVRGRGVMEKCTYCIQRVQNGKIEARRNGRGVQDGEVQSACQTACPTQAIVFGDVKQDTRVRKLQEDPRAYAMLAELNIKPRTLYLARVRNPHPRLKLAHQLAEATHGHGADHGESHDEHDSASAEAADHGEQHSAPEHAGEEH